MLKDFLCTSFNFFKGFLIIFILHNSMSWNRERFAFNNQLGKACQGRGQKTKEGVVLSESPLGWREPERCVQGAQRKKMPGKQTPR